MIQIDIDMPKSCVDCPCGDAQDGWCYVHNEVLERTENGYPSTETRPECCPLKEVEPLTDKEQRIFLSAMSREEKVCKEVDADHVREAYEDTLMFMCNEITRKVKKALWK